jgi:hypothetical protein
MQRRGLEKATSDDNPEKRQKRLAELAGGVPVIKVGAATETALEEMVTAARRASRHGLRPRPITHAWAKRSRPGRGLRRCEPPELVAEPRAAFTSLR